MHKMSTSLHKNSKIKRRQIVTKINYPADKINISSNANDHNNENDNSLSSNCDIERENRLSRVLSLHSMGLSQDEIARRMEVDQSTVSRDLQYIKQESRKRIDKHLREDVPFQHDRYLAGFYEIAKKLWHIADDYSIDPKVRIRALAILNQANYKRHDKLIGDPVDSLRTNQCLSDILQEFADNNLKLKDSIDR